MTNEPIGTRLLPALCLGAALGASGCATGPDELVSVEPVPEYSRPLEPGRAALRLVTDPDRLPDLETAWRNRDALLLESVERSVGWFEAPSSKRAFPLEGVTHERARASVRAMSDLLANSPTAYAFIADVERMFDVYESVGWDGSGTVLYTGYFAPIFSASRERTSRFTAPLYARPNDLVTDEKTGTPLGRRTSDGRMVSYPTRREIVEGRLLEGRELVWLEDELSAYLVHVNGSAKLRMRDGDVLHVGYAGKTGHPYASLADLMVQDGLLRPEKRNLQAIRHAYRRSPKRVEALMLENDSYVFFQEYDGGTWPAGSLGLQVTAERSLATDKAIYPRGGVVLVNTDRISYTGERRTFLRFMVDQDTGGAIKAPGRADIFMGVGDHVGILAGGQHAEGKLYYFFLKPRFVGEYAGTDG